MFDLIGPLFSHCRREPYLGCTERENEVCVNDKVRAVGYGFNSYGPINTDFGTRG